VRNINPSVKFVISSIIPRKNDKLINIVICQANKALKKVCSEDGQHFQDNDSDFLVNNQPIPSMYYDHIHLNRAGTYAFGTQLKHSISSVFNTSRRSSSQTRSGFEGTFSTMEANREELSPTLQLTESQP